jgi:hypothetical protein
MILQSEQMEGISIIETVIELTITIETLKDHVFCRPIIF